MHLAPGTRLGRYEIRSPLGAGGMAEVYVAEDMELGRKVALKLLPPDSTADEHARKRLLREARAIAALTHPHICAIYDVGESDGQRFIAMQLVDGEPLDVRLRRARLAQQARRGRRHGEELFNRKGKKGRESVFLPALPALPVQNALLRVSIPLRGSVRT